MNADFPSFVFRLWQDQPGMIILSVVGVIIFLLVVIDTHRHRKKLKRRHRNRHH